LSAAHVFFGIFLYTKDNAVFCSAELSERGISLQIFFDDVIAVTNSLRLLPMFELLLPLLPDELLGCLAPALDSSVFFTTPSNLMDVFPFLSQVIIFFL
jgi:hypothetical protein